MKLLLENWREFLKENKIAVDPKMTEVALNSMMAISVFKDEEAMNEEATAELNYIVSEASEPNSEVIQDFYDSLFAGERSGFLSPYSIDELSLMDLYLLDGHNAGFAIKDGDDIVSVHNNSDLRGLGHEFMRKAKEVGGHRLDHFDGFLSGLYRKYGFTNIYEIYQWDEQYRPAKWNYDSIDITNSATSVYANAIDELIYEDPETLPNEEVGVQAEDEYDIEINPNLKYNSYKYGRPDVIFRRLE
jgi:hypothetical protein